MINPLPYALLLASFIPALAQAQDTYQLPDGSTGQGKLFYIFGSGELQVRQPKKDKLFLRPAAVKSFTWHGQRFEPVFNFTVPRKEGGTKQVSADFAMVVDTGRVCLLNYIYSYDALAMASNNAITTRRVHMQTYLLNPRNGQPMLAVRDKSGPLIDESFNAEDYQLLLKVFNNDPELEQLIAQHRLNGKTLPDYVRAYNQRARQKS
ncbi:hypothetical protein [Hymenobacter jeollabukensis]|uniref:DUF4369 domain-containing protein n=1 Tax=Hymenobacter jeollabukensis TaxID=2025313 RepID=A0A5R8WJU4_9BACT|nr:hypothetical protein [Hymenobacter jeollabukensis]TLM89210.1 hypothetical protein FDY95_21820 [Hymenobacter jeollabukensis]